MRKTLLLLLPVLFCLASSNAQEKVKDSLKMLLQREKQDTARVMLLTRLSFAYQANKPDTAMLLALEGLSLSKHIGFIKGEAASLNRIGGAYSTLGNTPKAMEMFLRALKLNEQIDNVDGQSRNLNNIAVLYNIQTDYHQAIGYFLKGLKLNEQLRNNDGIAANLGNLGTSYFALKRYDSTMLYVRKAYNIAGKFNYMNRMGIDLLTIGRIYSEKGEKEQALYYYRRSIALFKKSELNGQLSTACLQMAKLFETEGRADSTLFYANMALAFTKELGQFTSPSLDASNFLYSFYKKKGNKDSALFYLEIAKSAADSVFSQQKLNQFHSLDFDEKMRRQEIVENQEKYNNRLKMYGLAVVVVVFLIISIILWRNNRQKNKANREIQKTLTELKQAQTKLIQSEKMASLGELTAGIAHEIQNPLNFVNNFSEVNKEMLEELKAESEKPKAERDEQLEIELINDIIQNEEKINHHGKRADGIVKGMLEHSRSRTGQKEPTDLNAMVDEFMRLSYHGLRAKDKAFNSELVTHFNAGMPKINVVQQDIGRVLLNLFNNAFYAVNQKKKTAGGDYKPEVSVTTSTEKGQVIIKVKDNGIGIPDAIKEKIMQPFFTTKPTGEGTGLGLSLTYDMVVKGHGGGITVNSKDGEGSEFIIQLPIS